MSKNKILFIASIGNCLELYDFALYGIMLPFFATKFFPAENQDLSLFLGFISFAITFIIAPIGSIFWGWYGDKFGRLSMLRLSMIIMAIPSFAIATLPTYHNIGIIAPILLMFFRIMQGISASGEVIGSKIFAMEALGQKYYGLASGIISGAGGLGVLIAMSMGYFCTIFKDFEYLWRFPFLLGSLLFIIAIYSRNILTKQSKHKQLQDNRNMGQIWNIIKSNSTQSIIVFALGAILGILSYTMHIFINPFLIKQNIDSNLVYQFSMIGLLITIISSVIIGFKIKNDNLEKITSIILLYITIFALPFFFCTLQPGWMMILGYIGLNSMVGLYATASTITMYRIFLPEIRCRGIMFNYAMGCAIFGGLTPLLFTLLANINLYLPGIIISLSSLIVLTIYKRNIKYVSMF